MRKMSNEKFNIFAGKINRKEIEKGYIYYEYRENRNCSYYILNIIKGEIRDIFKKRGNENWEMMVREYGEKFEFEANNMNKKKVRWREFEEAEVCEMIGEGLWGEYVVENIL